MRAVIEGHLDVARLLIARGAAINAHTLVWTTPGEFGLARPGGGPGTTLQRARPTPNGGMTPLRGLARIPSLCPDTAYVLSIFPFMSYWTTVLVFVSVQSIAVVF